MTYINNQILINHSGSRILLHVINKRDGLSEILIK